MIKIRASQLLTKSLVTYSSCFNQLLVIHGTIVALLSNINKTSPLANLLGGLTLDSLEPPLLISN